MENILVSIIIVNYQDPEDTLCCLRSLKQSSYSNVEIIVVDNGTLTDRTQLFKSSHEDCEVINSSINKGYAAGANLGIRQCKGDLILLLNNDTEVEADFILEMVKTFDSFENVGIVSPQIRFHHSKELVQYAGASNIHPIFGRGKKNGFKKPNTKLYDTTYQTELINGACMMIHRHVIEDVGLLPENYFMYYEEHDFTLRAKALGYQCYYCGSSIIYHKSGLNTDSLNALRTYYLMRNRLLFQRKFQTGYKLILSILYHYLIIFPKSILQRIKARDYEGVKSIFKAYSYHLKYSN